MVDRAVGHFAGVWVRIDKISLRGVIWGRIMLHMSEKMITFAKF